MRNKVNVEKESLDWSMLDIRVELLKKNTAKVKKETDELEKEYNSLIAFVRSFKPQS